MCTFIYFFLRRTMGPRLAHDYSKMVFRAIVLGLIWAHMFVFSYIWYDSLPEHSKNTYWYIHWITVFMILIWFYRTWATPQREIPQQDQVPEDQYCSKWNWWQPIRARHCRLCGVWVCKMDHHCPWLGTWIGYHNHKFFLLFLFYVQCAALMHVDVTIRFSFISGNPNKLFILIRFFYWFCNLFLYLITLVIISLLANMLLMAFWNVTTIEQYHGRPPGTKVCGFMYTNEFNRLWMNNLSDVLGDQMLLWLLPIKHNMDGDGLYYPVIPNVQMSDLTHTIDHHNTSVEQTFEMTESKESIRSYAKHAIYKQKDKMFLIGGNYFQVDESHPEFPKNKFYDEGYENDSF